MFVFMKNIIKNKLLKILDKFPLLRKWSGRFWLAVFECIKPISALISGVIPP